MNPNQNPLPTGPPAPQLPFRRRPGASAASQPGASPTPPLPGSASPGGYPQLRQPQPLNPRSQLAEGPSKAKLRLKALGVWVILIGVGAMAYFGSNLLVQLRPSEVALDSVPAFTLQGPEGFEGYQKKESETAGLEVYSTANGTCELAFGIVAAEDLPGSDLAAIVDGQIGVLRNDGVEAQGPTSGAALTFKDDSNPGKRYVTPTLSFTYTGDNVVTTRYSAAVLDDDTRALVRRQCSADRSEAAPDKTALDALDQTAQRLTVRPN